MNSGKVLLGLAVGVVAGGLFGVLFAPDKGSKTRKKISKKSGDYVNSLKETFDEFLDNVSQKFDAVKNEVTEFAEHNKTKLKEAQSDGKNVKV
ncbi:MAG: YtxH domain-containing protein [Bacteroidales bacterium]|nr:YtxH domain-containing protein [Bacteroidales bacterium]